MDSPSTQRPVTQSEELHSGSLVGRFLISAQLGIGGMGEVYRAEDTKLKRTVALKRIAPHLRSNPRFRERFLHEAECASRLNEPHIASIYDVVEEGDETFLVMEYVEGQTLRQRLLRPLPLPDFLAIAAECSAALTAAHERRVLHGDIKPENIMLTPSGHVKILDFGVAKVLPQEDQTSTLDETAAETRRKGGTLAYMAPEIILDKEPDGRADIFSLGVVFYEAVSGAHPFRSGNFLETCERIVRETPVPLSQRNHRAPPDLDRIVSKMLAKSPDDRYFTAADLLVDLRVLQQSTSGSLQLLTRPQLYPRPSRRKLALWTGFSVLALVAVMLAAIPSLRHRIQNWLGFPAVPREKLVAVLPFTTIGDDHQTSILGDGITETLTAQLARLSAVPTLQIVPAPDVRQRGVKTVDDARKELGATLVLVGSMQRAGNQLRINSALVDTHTHRQLRAESLTLPAEDTFAVQDQVVNSAVHMLELGIDPTERDLLQSHGTVNASAYDFYLQGRGYLQNYDNAENVRNAIKVFNEAVQLDPAYALAYAGRGDAAWKMYESTKDTQWIERSRKDCQQALSLQSGLPAAHVCLGTLYKGSGKYGQAVTEFEHAIQSEPSNYDAYLQLADAYDLLDKPALAEATYRRAIDLQPSYWAGYSWLGVFHYKRAEYAKAAEMFGLVSSLAPDNVRALYNLGATYVAMGKYDDAIAVLQRSLALRPSPRAYTNLANAYFYRRQYDLAAGMYEKSIQSKPTDALLWRNLGDGYYWTPGKREQAQAAYRRAIELANDKLRVNPKDSTALGVSAVSQAMIGEKKGALDALGRGLKLAPSDPEMLFAAALIHNHFGDAPQTLAWLNKAVSAGYSRVTVRDTPDFDGLRSNPAFQQLLPAPAQ
jgi:serine/threonine protein kinase/tetratricopeptide (TPR) repeat protein